jgi:hypothetical protein
MDVLRGLRTECGNGCVKRSEDGVREWMLRGLRTECGNGCV